MLRTADVLNFLRLMVQTNLKVDFKELYDGYMRDYGSFVTFTRVAVRCSQVLADVIWAVMHEEEDLIPEIIADTDLVLDGIDKVIAEARESMKTDEDRLALVHLYAQHRHDAGYRTDDVALRKFYQAWKATGQLGSLPRRDDEVTAGYAHQGAARKAAKV